jgi:hypothetical protein
MLEHEGVGRTGCNILPGHGAFLSGSRLAALPGSCVINQHTSITRMPHSMFRACVLFGIFTLTPTEC